MVCKSWVIKIWQSDLAQDPTTTAAWQSQLVIMVIATWSCHPPDISWCSTPSGWTKSWAKVPFLSEFFEFFVAFRNIWHPLQLMQLRSQSEPWLPPAAWPPPWASHPVTAQSPAHRWKLGCWEWLLWITWENAGHFEDCFSYFFFRRWMILVILAQLFPGELQIPLLKLTWWSSRNIRSPEGIGWLGGLTVSMTGVQPGKGDIHFSVGYTF